MELHQHIDKLIFAFVEAKAELRVYGNRLSAFTTIASNQTQAFAP